jgi:hypothetical protein
MALAARPRRVRVGGVLLLLLSAILAVLWARRSPAPASILLISVDTLRADHVGSYGYPRSTTPFIDSLADQGLLFENAMVPLPATDPSHASLLTALHPARHGLLANGMPLGPGIETMAEVLARRGYFTMGITAVAHLSRDYGFDRGFADFSDVRDRVSRPAPEVNAAAIAMLDDYVRLRTGTPFFLFVHYFDPHTPYELHSRYRPVEPISHRQLSLDDRERVDGYDSEIRLVDAHVEQLLARISALGLDRRLLLCVLSDHGEQFGEHGFSGGHADFYRETVRVPLICRGPGIPRGRVDRVVSSLDIAPSLLKAAGTSFSRSIDGLDTMIADHPQRPDASRTLLVLGYPSYTRSLQVIRDPWVFIRNLDPVYRGVGIETLAGDGASKLLRDGYREVPPRRSDDKTVTFALPQIDFEPHVISAIVVPGDAPCEGAIALKLEPRLSYLAEPIRFTAAVRVDYPVSRFDRTSLVISPRRCVGSVFFKPRRLKAKGLTRANLIPLLFENLQTARKDSRQDEVFDFRLDPAMVGNLIDSPRGQLKAAELGSETRRLFDEYRRQAIGGDDQREYTPTELELLRSLGYVQ